MALEAGARLGHHEIIEVLWFVGPYGHAGMGLGENVAAAEPSPIALTISEEADLEELTVDGIRMIFQNTQYGVVLSVSARAALAPNDCAEL